MNMNESRHSLLYNYEVWIASRSFSVLSSLDELKKDEPTDGYILLRNQKSKETSILATLGTQKFEFRAYFIP